MHSIAYKGKSGTGRVLETLPVFFSSTLLEEVVRTGIRLRPTEIADPGGRSVAQERDVFVDRQVQMRIEAAGGISYPTDKPALLDVTAPSPDFGQMGVPDLDVFSGVPNDY